MWYWAKPLRCEQIRWSLPRRRVGYRDSSVTAPLLILIVTRWKPPDSIHRVVLMAAALAVLSSVIPYVLDQLVLRMVGRASFALLLALLPTTAVIVGFLVLGQVPTTPEVLGIALVVVALVISDHNA